VLFIVSLIVFLLTRALPGGPARAILGNRATAIAVADFNHRNGFDQPLPVQFATYVNGLLHGDLGFSYHLNQSVVSLIGENLPKTLLLMGTATALALILAVPAGMLQAVRRNRIEDHIITIFFFVFYSMPAFWLGIILIILFAANLQILPSQGPQGALSTFGTQLNALILPVATMGLGTLAWFSRYMRSAMVENLVQDYVRTARAKGLSQVRTLFVHVLPNSLLSTITLLGFSIPWIFSGALITEALFNYPGMGFLFWTAAQSRDYPVILGVTLVVAIATVVGNLLADILYAVADPRVQYE
jgi:peptide/nickel transport system permease protein